jgi:hypothetical protein
MFFTFRIIERMVSAVDRIGVLYADNPTAMAELVGYPVRTGNNEYMDERGNDRLEVVAGFAKYRDAVGFANRLGYRAGEIKFI